ncbi:MAG TPA: enoyl-CoA hydratase-related protein [Candidatus Limnocylindrales bacterium]|nr:enoyl-CoA hydratase-related protein [Candidatus Limnocylindrales bacterium]
MGWTAWERVEGDGLDFTDVVYEKKYHTELWGGPARITVNRPGRYNAMTQHTHGEMLRAFDDAGHDPRVVAVVLTGAGDHFGVGGDVEDEQRTLREQFVRGFTLDRLVRLCRKPVIAMVKGFCIGASHHLAYCCDFTIAADNAVFGQNGPRVSSPADGFILPYLVRVVGAKKAREIWMLCRRYSASEALEMGLVNTVVALDRLEDEVDRWCEEMLGLSPGCLEILKASFDWEIDTMPQLGVLSNWLYPDWFESDEGREGARAFLEKRPAAHWKIRRAEAEARAKVKREMAEDGRTPS